MTDHDLAERPIDTTTAPTGDLDDRTAAYVDFLAGEFPDWRFAIDATATWSDADRTLWVATRDGHHPQSELTAGKLHRRLSDYEARLAARGAGDN